MDAEDRKRLRAELKKIGIKGDYLDSWQPRKDLWRHTAMLNNEGKEAKPAGMYVPNQPGDPDSLVRLSVRGLLPWKPTKDCRCKACRERDWQNTFIDRDGENEYLLAAEVRTYKCECGWEPAPGKNPGMALKAHQRGEKKRALEAAPV